MGTQVLFYESAVQLSSERHRDWSIKKGTDYSFAKHVNAVPLTAVEFAKAALEYAIVFANSGDTVMPTVILGIQNKQNLYLNADGTWQAKYIPAFVRRYPFIFSRTPDDTKFALCLDESFSGCNQEGLGERLFDAQGTRTEYLGNVLDFLRQYQGQFQLTEAFGKKLKELNLLEPMHAKIRLKSGQQMSIGGFMAINRERLKALPADKLAELMQSNELELMYIHMQSMGHFSDMVNRLSETEAEEGSERPTISPAVKPAAEAEEPESEKENKKTATAAKK
ncbi:MAG: SapC family protein, partial [Candidatus Poribacteria bacterium]